MRDLMNEFTFYDMLKIYPNTLRVYKDFIIFSPRVPMATNSIFLEA